MALILMNSNLFMVQHWSVALLIYMVTLLVLLQIMVFYFLSRRLKVLILLSFAVKEVFH